jgi:hypothetical protein
MSLFKILFLGELGTCGQNLIPTRSVQHQKKNHFRQGSVLKFVNKGSFLFDNKKKMYKKSFYWKSKLWVHARVPILHLDITFFEIIKILNFGGISKFLKLLWVGSFGQILPHWQWLRACPKQGWNLKNPSIHQPWIQKLYGATHRKAAIHIYNLKSFKESTNSLHSQHFAQKPTRPFWLL